METVETNKAETEVRPPEDTVKGTMFSVGVVGAVILITYLIVYGLYMVRV